MRKRLSRILPIAFVLVLILAAIAYLSWVSDENGGPLQASGTVETVEIAVAAESGGKVVEVFVAEGDQVQAGDPLFRLDDALLNAQRQSAEAALDAAQTALDSAQLNLEAAQLQYELALQTARLADREHRQAGWNAVLPDDFDLPAWYFNQSEALVAAQAEVDAARVDLDSEMEAWNDLLARLGETDLLEAETRLLEAQLAYQVAQSVLLQADLRGDQELQDYAQGQFDAAEIELQAAQTAYDQLLGDQTAEDVLEARARVAVARERYYTALDQFYALQTGDDSLQVQLAVTTVQQAEAAVAQVEANRAQVEAELALIDLQLDKLLVKTPVAGVVLTRNLEPGEVIAAGAALITVGQLDALTITVYLPEDQYGNVQLGGTAEVTVDSFPDETFSATVIRIANEAEFTPRNVQTAEGRRTTVFAVELSVDDPAGKLKPGMPADVTFTE